MSTKEQKVVTPTDLDPEVFEKKTVGSKDYITLKIGINSGNDTDTNEVQFGPETKTVENVQVNDGKGDATLVFTEVLNHNQQGKRMFVCTDVIRTGVSSLSPVTNENDYNRITGVVASHEPGRHNLTLDIPSSITHYPFSFVIKGNGLDEVVVDNPYDNPESYKYFPTSEVDVEQTPEGFRVTVKGNTTNADKLFFDLSTSVSFTNVMVEFPNGHNIVIDDSDGIIDF